MNCKQGDLAIVVKSVAGNEGKIVRCIRLLGEQLWNGPGGIFLEPTWEIDRPLVGFSGDVGNNICDSQLRPIRDPGDDATDETLLWLPSPGKVTEAA